jgi:hypothetical protein
MEAINSVRVGVWKQQPASFFDRAVIDADGTIAPTNGQCKAGMDISYNGQWSYHPLVVSLANTREPLYLLNRSGNRPSHENAAEYLDKAIALCRQAGFKLDPVAGRHGLQSDRPPRPVGRSAGRPVPLRRRCQQNPEEPGRIAGEIRVEELERPPRYEVKTKNRAPSRPTSRSGSSPSGTLRTALACEHVAEIEYQPAKCTGYRLIICRKTIDVEMGQEKLWDEYRYFFYITNDRVTPADQLVLQANGRCDQENLIEQLKNGVSAMKLPVDNLLSNWAYMVMASWRGASRPGGA